MRTTLTESDVVFMYWTDDPEVFRAYGATVLGWGGAHKRKRVELLKSLDVHPTGSMWCLTAGGRSLYTHSALQEAVVRDITGAPIIVPWLPDATYAGIPAYWGCSNHPAFRAHTRREVCRAMAAGADGLHVDDHLGTAHPTIEYGGCFCDYCMAKFAQYLAFWHTPEMLEAAGVETPEALKHFDYRILVRRYATTKEEYVEQQRAIPLHRDFVTFQLESAAENVRQLHRLASDVVERPVTLSANTSLPSPMHMVVAPSVSYLIGEVEQSAPEGVAKSGNAVVAYRLAEALGKPLAATPFGADWAYVKDHEPLNMVKYWIAQAYACGQRLMAPAKMWCYYPETGTDYYYGPTEVFAPMYQFIRKHARYFDGYRSAGARTMVVINPKSMLFGPGYTMQLLNGLAMRNVPFTVRIPLDDWNLGEYLRAQEVRNYDRVILADHPDEPLNLGATDRETLAKADAACPVVTWPTAGADEAALDALIAETRTPWKVEDGDVWVFPRKKRNAPPVIHLLNRAYDRETDTFTPQRDVTIRLDQSILPRSGKQAILYRYDGEPLPVAMTRTREEIRLTIPELGIWGMVVIE